MMFSFKTLAFAWTGLAGAAAVGAGALQASYAPPTPSAAPPAASVPASLPPTTSLPSPAPPIAAPVPFENRSLLTMLPPPELRPHPAPRVAAAPLPLPLPPVPPTQTVRIEPRRAAPSHPAVSEPLYAAEPSYPGWERGRFAPYPGQYASSRAYFYGGPPTPYGW